MVTRANKEYGCMELSSIKNRTSGVMCWGRLIISVTLFSIAVMNAIAFTSLSPSQARDWRDSGADILLLDIREQNEWDGGHIPDAILMPWNSGYLQAHHDELPDKPIVVYCRTGNRSVSGSTFLESQGHTDIYNMTGGITQWVTLSAPAQVIVQGYTFTSDNEGWAFNGPSGLFDVPLSADGGGSIDLSPGGSSNSFSYWYSPDVTIEDRKQYRSTWTVGSDVTDPDDAVQFRMRVNQKGAWSAWDRTVNSNMDAAPSSGDAKDYTVHFNPMVSGTDDNAVVMSFDIMSFDPADDVNSWLYLEEMSVEHVSLFTSKDHEIYYFSSPGEWTFKGQLLPYDEPSSSDDNSRIGLSPAGSANCFSYWESPDIQINSGKTYRAIYKVESSITDSDNVPAFRLRVNQKGTWSGWGRMVTSNLSNAPSTGSPFPYTVILDPVVTGPGDNDVVLAFDILSFDTMDDMDSWVYVNSVVLEELTIQP
jgi:rhodanese-related sulfurtransferase